MRPARWAHSTFSAFLWAVLWLPLGSLNQQMGEPWLSRVSRGRLLTVPELLLLSVVTLPCLLTFAAWRRGSARLLVLALLVDAGWLGVEVQSWPYGAALTSAFPAEVHAIIVALLVLALATGAMALRGWTTPAAVAARLHQAR